MTFVDPKPNIAPSWYKQRGYAHFDRESHWSAITPAVTNPAMVSRWQFWPLLRYTMIGDHARGKEQRLPSTKWRPIAYPAHRDAHLYAYYATLLADKYYEPRLVTNGLTDCVIAFRANGGKSTIDYAHEVFSMIDAMPDALAIAFDVSGFFDNLDHALLKQRWCELLSKHRLPDDHYAVFKSLTQYAFVNKRAALHELRIGARREMRLDARNTICTAKEFRDIIRDRNLISVHTDKKGIPQGTPISAFLSNVYMLPFDIDIHKEVTRVGGRYWRYCDDILVVVPAVGQGIRAIIESRICSELLSINESKTETVYFLPRPGVQGKRAFAEQANGTRKPGYLQYLGLTYDGEGVAIRQKSLDKQIRRVSRSVRLALKTMRKWNIQRSRDGLALRPLYKRKLLEIHSSRGKRNFVTYGKRAARGMHGLKTTHIAHQLARHVARTARFICVEERHLGIYSPRSDT